MNLLNIKFFYKYSVTVIFFSFLLSLANSTYNLKKFDKTIYSYSEKEKLRYHQMIKSDTLRYLTHGAEIKRDLDNKKKFFSTGRVHYTKYLPPRLAAIYYYIFDINLFNNWDEKKINEKVHYLYLYIQCIIYFVSIFFLYKVISKKFSQRVCFFTVLFLCLEPTIFQYHATFWSESFFFSIQIVILTLLLSDKSNIFKFFVLGIFLSLLAVQRSPAFYYSFLIILFFLITLKYKYYYKIILILLGLALVQSVVGYNNYVRSGLFYIMPNETKLTLQLYIIPKVISKVSGISYIEVRKEEGIKAYNWLLENKIEVKDDLNSLDEITTNEVRNLIVKEVDRFKYANHIKSRTIQLLKEKDNFFPFINQVISKSFHILLLNPFHIYSDHNFQSGRKYYVSKLHKKLIPIRIFYSLVIYLIIGIGIYKFFEQKENRKIFMLFLFSAFYFYISTSWHGNTRYFVPVLIYLSFFFGFGIEFFLKYLDKKKDKINF